VIERSERIAKQIQKVLSPFVAQVDLFTQEKGAIDAEEFLKYDMIISDHHFMDVTAIQLLKSNAKKVILSQSILEENPEDHQNFAVDYLISKPFTAQYLLEMLVVFYGAAEPSEIEPSTVSSTSSFDTFISDAEIPIATNIKKKDFEIFKGAKVLIVEDNLINQRVIKGLLGDSGIVLSFAENGLDALEVVE